jgi:hypothetical protein
MGSAARYVAAGPPASVAARNDGPPRAVRPTCGQASGVSEQDVQNSPPI